MKSMNPLLVGLNPAQHQAVTHGIGPLLIVAGAGTGKTTVVTRRIAWLINEQSVKPEEILALTFTEKAAGEMEERVDSLLPMGYVELSISTFHSFCEKVLREHGLDIGLSSDFTLLDEAEQAILVRENLGRFELKYYRPLGNPTKFVTSLLRHFSRVKDEAIRPEEYLEHARQLTLDMDVAEGKATAGADNAREISEAERVAEVANAYHTYQRLLFEKGALDFGDLITQTLYLFQQRPQILQRYRERFRYIFVDEFQDTNWAQYELIKLVAAPHHNLTVVGDDDQSIYKFRGASVANILAFKQDYPDTTEVVLTENYRNAQNILDLAYEFIQHNNPYRLEVQLNGATATKKKKGAAQHPTINKRLTAATPGSGQVAFWQLPTLEQEAAAVVDKITTTFETAEGGELYGNFAILVRANDSATPFLQRLKARNVPYQFIATAGLYHQPLIVDILNYLRVLGNVHDSPSLYRVLTMPTFKLPLDDVMGLLAKAREDTASLYQVVQKVRALTSLRPETASAVERVLGLIQQHVQLARYRPVTEVAYRMVSDTGLLKELTANEDADHLEQVVYLNQLFKLLQNFQTRHLEPTVEHFLNELAYAQDVGDTGRLQPPEWEEGPDSVKVMTVHGAKGLEFKHVFIVNMVDKRFPTIERREPIELPDALIREKLPEGDWHLQEERRLLYVGITRAKQSIYFTAAEDYGGVRKKKPSRFMAELGLEPTRLPGPPVTAAPAASTAGGRGAARVDEQPEALRHRLPEEFSFTQLQAFRTCPKQYKYSHLLKIPRAGQATLSFGKTIHQALCHFFKLARARSTHEQSSLFSKQSPTAKTFQPPVSWEELKKMYEDAWTDSWYETPERKEEYRQRGYDYLKRFYDHLPRPWPEPKALEQEFVIKVNGHRFKGAIDRIDEVDGGIEIIDYKTSERPPTDPKKANLEQLHIYAVAAREALGHEPVTLTYHYLANGEPTRYPVDEEKVKKTKEQIIETIEKIEQSDFRATPSKIACDHCDFKTICEDRWWK